MVTWFMVCTNSAVTSPSLLDMYTQPNSSLYASTSDTI